VRGLNLAFSIFVIRQILELFKALKNRLNLESKFKTLLLILFTANFINLLKNFTSKFIKFTKKALRQKLEFGFFESVKQLCFSLSQKTANLSVVVAPKSTKPLFNSNNKFARQVYGIFGIAAFVCIPSCVKFDLKELK
jgi:hypothetical protein